MDRAEFRRLLRRYADGTCTERERRQVEAEVLRNPIAGNWEWNSAEERILMGVRIRKAIDERRAKARPRGVKTAWLAGIAASLLIAVGVRWYVGGTDRDGHDAVMISETAPYPSDGVRLTLADGSVVGLDTVADGVVGVDITKLGDGRLVYAPSSGHPVAGSYRPDMQNTLHVPNGKRFRITLPDGTNAWINAATSLTYPVAFPAHERRVFLDGEAYFEVASDRAKPFRVVAQGTEITVTGTQFNVSAYFSDRLVRTTLIEGGVAVSLQGKTLSLVPGDEAVSTSDGMLLKNLGNTEQALAWKNGYFLFEDMDIVSVMRSVARWYDITVVVDRTVFTKRFGGSFPITGSLDDLLGDLGALADVTFERNGKEVRIR